MLSVVYRVYFMVSDFVLIDIIVVKYVFIVVFYILLVYFIIGLILMLFDKFDIFFYSILLFYGWFKIWG